MQIVSDIFHTDGYICISSISVVICPFKTRSLTNEDELTCRVHIFVRVFFADISE